MCLLYCFIYWIHFTYWFLFLISHFNLINTIWKVLVRVCSVLIKAVISMRIFRNFWFVLVNFLRSKSSLKALKTLTYSSAFMSSIIKIILCLLQENHLLEINKSAKTWIIYDIKLIFMTESHLFWSEYRQQQMSWWL